MAQRWLETAGDDLRAARALAEASLHAHACFAAQQCGEKAVKSLWYAIGEDPWGHSVQKLVADFPARDRIPDLLTWTAKAAASVLLKILSWIAEPTKGRAEIHGRVRALLEVGTGFHPELTGRENIFLNGAILGMKRREMDAGWEKVRP